MNNQIATTTTKPTNPKDAAAADRLDLSLFPSTALAYGALGMTEGDCKYGGYNYRPSGVLASVYKAACERHLAKWYNGEWADKKTNVPHLASAISCLAILIDAFECGVLQDDRPPQVDMDRVITGLNQTVRHLKEIYPNPPGRYTQSALAAKAPRKEPLPTAPRYPRFFQMLEDVVVFSDAATGWRVDTRDHTFYKSPCWTIGDMHPSGWRSSGPEKHREITHAEAIEKFGLIEREKWPQQLRDALNLNIKPTDSPLNQ